MTSRKTTESDYIFYLCSFLFVGTYFLDWVMGMLSDGLTLAWLLLALALCIFLTYHAFNAKRNIKQIGLSLVLLSFLLLSTWEVGNVVKRYTLGEVVFQMQFNDISTIDIIIRRKNSSLKAYRASYFVVSTSHDKYDVSIEEKKILLKNGLSELVFHCKETECKGSRVGDSYSIYINKLFYGQGISAGG